MEFHKINKYIVVPLLTLKIAHAEIKAIYFQRFMRMSKFIRHRASGTERATGLANQCLQLIS